MGTINNSTSPGSLSNWSLSTTSSTGTSAPSLALSGLTSGIDTTSIVNEMMSIDQIPEQKLQIQLSQEQARAAAVTSIKNELMTLQTDEQALQSPGLWAPTQTASTSDSSVATALMTGGAGPGGYQVSVTHLALSAQRTFTYSSPTSDDTLTVGGVQIVIPAGSDINTAVSTINSANNSPVYAAAVTDPSSGNQDLVLSSRQTGASNGFTASDSNGSISEITGDAVAGQDAAFTVNGGNPMTSSSNVVTNAIPGVQLTLTGLTGSTPLTVNVSNPAPNESAIQSAVQAFVTQYNSTVSDIQTQLTTAPVVNPQNATDAAQGVLYGDMGLQDLLDQLRESFSGSYAPGNPSNLQLLSQIGLSTGAAVGSGGLNDSSISGQITFDTSAFSSAMATNPNAVQTLLGGGLNGNGFVQSFDASLNPWVTPGGILDSRVSDSGETESELSSQISDMQAALATERQTLTQEFTNMETAMQSANAQGNWLAGQIGTLPTTSSSSSSSSTSSSGSSSSGG